MPRARTSARASLERAAESVEAKGIYTVPAAARLLREHPATIRRWAFGYQRCGTAYPAAIATRVAPLAGRRVLTFLELVELMFIQGMLRSGLSWPKVREASRVARRLLGDEPHPFATKRWFVDAAAIYLTLGREHGEEILIEVAGHAQVAMEPVLRPYLTQLDFDVRGVARRWFPCGVGTSIVVDPRRSFGMPVTAKGGVPTDTLAALQQAGDTIPAIAAWYRMDEAEVAAAVAFERSLARAA